MYQSSTNFQNTYSLKNMMFYFNFVTLLCQFFIFVVLVFLYIFYCTIQNLIVFYLISFLKRILFLYLDVFCFYCMSYCPKQYKKLVVMADL